MTAQTAYTLINPDNKNVTFKVFYFDDSTCFEQLQRLPCYTMVLVLEGSGKLHTDFSAYSFKGNTMMCFSPCQPYRISSAGALKGFGLNFHSDFFCVFKHHQEVACNGVLFDNVYQSPILKLEQATADNFKGLAEQMKDEIKNAAVAQYELVVSYLKIFLITATRIKISQQPEAVKALPKTNEPLIIQKLKDAIEHHYRTKHAPSDYADLLNISPKSLARLTRKHFNKTLSDLISERIVVEAKRELYLTSKTVKAVAFDLGFQDEHYFSRFFKAHADVSPQRYRHTVGYARAEI